MKTEIEELANVLSPIILSELQERLNDIVPLMVESALKQAMLLMSESAPNEDITLHIPAQDVLLKAITEAG